MWSLLLYSIPQLTQIIFPSATPLLFLPPPINSLSSTLGDGTSYVMVVVTGDGFMSIGIGGGGVLQ